MMKLHFTPNIAPGKIRENLFRLIIPGKICDGDMQSRIKRLGSRFGVYASTCPFGLWAPGLAITGEMRAVTECYLPLAEINSAWNRFLSLSLRYAATMTGTAIRTADCWLDVLQRLHPYVFRSDPAELLRRLLEDEDFRIGFLFALFLPGRHGGGFRRYPGQIEFLRRWLEKENYHGKRVLRCLDAACATGESTYDLVLLLLENGLSSESFLVHGSTIEPLELFSAAHVFFPHASDRQQTFLCRTAPVFAGGACESMAFFTEDIRLPCTQNSDRYDIILCNGLLGGPQFPSADRITTAVSALRTRLHDGGIILCADHFHGGWKKLAPPSLLTEVFTQCGFSVREIADGLVAEKHQ
ncbi:MAG: methyltransferase, CheR-type [Geobacteraceae bacterium]|nr:methyltransferase, CheR-type [Geobacteraceae bacterium]